MTYPCQGCPMKPYCLARLNDRTITGCGIPLYMTGQISKDEINVEHTVRGEKNEVN